MNQADDHTSSHTSPLLIGKLLAGKATDEEVRAAERHAGACARCREELDQARAAGRRFAERVFPRTLGAVAARRAPPPRWRLLLPIALVAATASALVLVRRSPSSPAVQYKGAATLQVFAHRGGASFPVGDGTALRAGDRIRFGVFPGGARFVLVGSVDGRGRASIYQASTAIAGGEGPTTVLPGAIVLDDAPGPERIFAVFSERRLEDAEVTAALAAVGAQGAGAIRGTHRLALPYPQASILFEKDAGMAPP